MHWAREWIACQLHKSQIWKPQRYQRLANQCIILKSQNDSSTHCFFFCVISSNPPSMCIVTKSLLNVTIQLLPELCGFLSSSIWRSDFKKYQVEAYPNESDQWPSQHKIEPRCRFTVCNKATNWTLQPFAFENMVKHFIFYRYKEGAAGSRNVHLLIQNKCWIVTAHRWKTGSSLRGCGK